jgi:hypothetical protein
VVTDRLTIVTHFIPVKQTSLVVDIVPLYSKEVVRLHGMPKSIASDQDSKFWHSLHNDMGTKLGISVAFHPQMDGQSERTIQTLEDMLSASVLSRKGNWEDHCHTPKFKILECD